MKTLLLFCLLVILPISLQAQRHLPYPIIFIHGFSGSASDWDNFNGYLNTRLGLSIEYNNINICLNSDGDTRYSSKYRDVHLYPTSLSNKDVYRVNFDVCQGSTYSNQSGAVKQGFALRLAIQSVLNATGAEKVILFGHSMGGLAGREYVQNPGNWQGDGQHHVAKLITLGTPHQGSNLGTGDINFGSIIGYDEASEAVRDLRTSYKTNKMGTYLYGGIEMLSYIQRGFGSYFHNIDVDSNGYEGDLVTGLNNKGMPLNLAHSSIIATGIMGINGDGDGAVLSYSQDLGNANTGYKTLKIDRFYHSCSNFLDLFCHSREPKEATFPSMYALDEPSETDLAYRVEFNKDYIGTFTNQSNGSFLDQDKFKIYAPQRGILTFSGDFQAASNAQFRVINQAGYVIAIASNSSNRIIDNVQIPNAGTYYLEITGNSSGSWSPYFYRASFCPMPSQLSLSSSGPPTFCEGRNITISATSGYDGYRWYLNGQQISENSNTITVSKAGTYSAQAVKCGVSTSPNNTITTVVLPSPPKPTITKKELPDNFQLTSSSPANNQWYFNNQPIQGAAGNEHIPQALGSYHVAVNQQSCVSASDPVNIGMDQPGLTIQGKNPLCDGDSVMLIAPTGFGSYIFSDGQSEKEQHQNILTVKRTSTYTLKTKRGPFVSPPSSPVEIVVNPLPSKPTITLLGYNLISSSPTNNQWYLNSQPIDTTQELKSLTSGAYMVRVTQLGCFSESEPFVITALDPTGHALFFKVYPNPTTGQFRLEAPKAGIRSELTITDLSGKVLLNRVISDQKNGAYLIDFRHPPGLYIIQLKSGDYQGLQKLIVN